MFLLLRKYWKYLLQITCVEYENIYYKARTVAESFVQSLLLQ